MIWFRSYLNSRCFPYFLQFKSEFGTKEFIIWATVCSRSCFCWLHRASPTLAAKNKINLISVLTVWWCPCVESSLFTLTSAFSWQNSISLCPSSFCAPRPNMPVTTGVSWLPTFAFQFPIMKRTSFSRENQRKSLLRRALLGSELTSKTTFARV